jgi:hypothetical protein
MGRGILFRPGEALLTRAPRPWETESLNGGSALATEMYNNVVPGGVATYNGHPLYVYSAEEAIFVNGQPLDNGTAGNGNGLRGPHGGTFSVLQP